MQKMQSAAGGKGRGANGAPTPAQIQAMQACPDSNFTNEIIWLTTLNIASNASRYAAANAATNAKWWGYARDDEGYDARPRRRSCRDGRNAAYVLNIEGLYTQFLII